MDHDEYSYKNHKLYSEWDHGFYWGILYIRYMDRLLEKISSFQYFQDP
jgi:hypothetical protein